MLGEPCVRAVHTSREVGEAKRGWMSCLVAAPPRPSGGQPSGGAGRATQAELPIPELPVPELPVPGLRVPEVPVPRAFSSGHLRREHLPPSASGIDRQLPVLVREQGPAWF